MTALSFCNCTSCAQNAAAGWQTAVREMPSHRNTQTHSVKHRGGKKKLSRKSFGGEATSGQGREVGLIKSCCSCGALVTRSHAITEISVCEESAPTTHFLPIEEGGRRGQNGTVCCTKHKGGIVFFIWRNLRIQKKRGEKRKGGEGVSEEEWSGILILNIERKKSI